MKKQDTDFVYEEKNKRKPYRWTGWVAALMVLGFSGLSLILASSPVGSAFLSSIQQPVPLYTATPVSFMTQQFAGGDPELTATAIIAQAQQTLDAHATQPGFISTVMMIQATAQVAQATYEAAATQLTLAQQYETWFDGVQMTLETPIPSSSVPMITPTLMIFSPEDCTPKELHIYTAALESSPLVAVVDPLSSDIRDYRAQGPFNMRGSANEWFHISYTQEGDVIQGWARAEDILICSAPTEVPVVVPSLPTTQPEENRPLMPTVVMPEMATATPSLLSPAAATAAAGY